MISLSIILFVYITIMLKLDGLTAGANRVFSIASLTIIVTVAISTIMVG